LYIVDKMKPNGFGQRQLSEDSGSNRKKQLARSDATCSEDIPRPATAGRPPQVFSHSEAPWYTDKTGVNLIQFVRNTLHKNPKDREMMLSLERDMRAFIQDTEKRALRFPKMSSYNRMLIHRAAAFFGLDHNIDNSASSVICTKTPKTRIPEIDFKSLIDGNIFTDHMLRNQYPRRSAQSFDECYTPSRGNRRQYRNAQSNSLDLTRRGNSIEFEPSFMGQPQMIPDSYGLPTAVPNTNIIYQTTPYSGPPICVPYVCKENPLQEYYLENQQSEDGTELRNTSSTNTNTATSEENEQCHYLQPIYDPAYFTSLHTQAVTYHANPGVPVGYLVFQDSNVKLVPQADVSNLAAQFSSLQLSNPGLPQSPQTPGMPYSTPTPPNAYTVSPANPRGIPYATMEGGYSTPPMNPPSSNLTYVTPESPGIVYAAPLPVGSCGMTYASSPPDPSIGIPYQGYPNTMYLPMYTMFPNVVPAQQQQQYPSSAAPPPQYDTSMPGSSSSNI
jgi:hypothetical protein